MRRHHVAATAVLVALTTIMLSACGPDDGTSTSAVQSGAAPNAVASADTSNATQSAHDTSPALTPPSAFGASAVLTNVPNTDSHAAPGTAPDNAVQNVEASLAADSQQVTPVLHYAPGDSDQNGKNN